MEKQTKNDSFIRWQATTITQFGYTLNLVLTLSVASLGFAATLLTNDNFSPVGVCKFMYLCSLICLVSSIMLGIWCSINRLTDFRLTAKITRLRNKADHVEDVKKLRIKTVQLGKKTWELFYFQIGSFGGGILLLILTVAVINIEKLI